MNIFLKLKQEQMMQVFYIFNSNRKSKLEFILNETKNIKHQPLVFFFFETGDCWIQRLSDKIYYTGFKAQANKTTADGNTEK
jgi:hypothetical protein